MPRRHRKPKASPLAWWVYWWHSPLLAARRAARASNSGSLTALVVTNAALAGAMAARWAMPHAGAAAMVVAAVGAAVVLPLALVAAAFLLHAVAVALGGRGNAAALLRALAPSSVLWPLAVLCRMVPGGSAASAALGFAALLGAVGAAAVAEHLAPGTAWLAVGLAAMALAAVVLTGHLLL
jgi:hypothetical protein